ncbi:MAG TPA: efflux RND transporter periplasmic adaptor subunit [Steroidobacteraceae bacterium]|nr:efflux RND transporter periplasmic adaptor subunit [Steroidobacteraceae bacterium]
MSPSPRAADSRLHRLHHAAIAASLLLAACGQAGAPQFPPPDVSVAPVVRRSVTEWDDYSGHIEAIESAEIRPRVAGHLNRVHYREGGLVEKDQLLFTIDDREYRAAADAARADLVRAKARLTLARQELARAESLIAARAVSQGELESRRVEFQQAEADKLSAQARLAQAELDLGFTRVTAPFAGRAGEALVKPGNLVTPNQALLTTLVSIDPVYVTFEGDERAYLRYQELARGGGRESSRDARNPVHVGLANEEGYPHQGEMDFVDNALNPATGTIRARAVLPNPDGVFTPGLFARVRLLGESQTDALLIHEQAVLTDQDRRYVYVVGKGDSVERRDVKLGAHVEGLRIVESGLARGDKVVVNGMRKIFFAGQPVSPREVPMDDPNRPAPPAPEQQPAG